MPPRQERPKIEGVVIPNKGILTLADANTVISHLRSITHGTDRPGEKLAHHLRQLGWKPKDIVRLIEKLGTTRARNFKSMKDADMTGLLENLSSAHRMMAGPARQTRPKDSVLQSARPDRIAP